MEKEKVLEFEIINMNDTGITGRLKQNTNVLKRGRDTEYSRAYIYPCWDIINKTLYTYGENKEYDDLIFTVPKSDITLFSNKIEKINEKYGMQKRWRATKNEKYFYIETSFNNIIGDEEEFDCIDNSRYKIGNYFKTQEEAKKVKEELDKFWAKVRAGEIGENNMEKFEVRQYFDTYLEKKWIFDSKEEADKFYKLMDDKRNSHLVQYEIREVVGGKNVEM